VAEVKGVPEAEEQREAEYLEKTRAGDRIFYKSLDGR
jgi:hypothetical protein